MVIDPGVEKHRLSVWMGRFLEWQNEQCQACFANTRGIPTPILSSHNLPFDIAGNSGYMISFYEDNTFIIKELTSMISC